MLASLLEPTPPLLRAIPDGLTDRIAHMLRRASPDLEPQGPDRARPLVYGVRSIGVALRGPRLRRFLEGRARFVFLPPGVPAPRGIDGLAGWGAKGTARAEAGRLGLPYLALEDGFLRTAGLGGRKDRSLSLTADPVGVYYDAAAPSALERLIADWQAIGSGELADARRLMALMREANLGKFNGAPDVADDEPILADGPPVLVVDQIARDMSISGGGCSAGTFAAMLDAAMAENPGRRIVARVHPFEGVGGRKGHLRELAARRGVMVYDRDVSWMSLARRAARVYVATSQAGLEALIAGVPVTCFGLAPYSGWGLTDDRMACPRRTARPTLEAVVAAAYLRYCRYLSPLTGEPCSALEIARLLAARRRRDAETAGITHVLGVHPWKHRAVRPFVQGRRSTVTWTMRPEQALKRQEADGGRIVAWSSRAPEDFAERCAAQGAPFVRMEDGFVRSVGLGANLEAPWSLVLDRSGVYYDPSGPSDLETILQTGDFPTELVERAAALRRQITAANLSKYNVGSPEIGALMQPSAGRRRILVPAQVANDASVMRGGGRIKDNLGLLRAVRESNPDAFIVFKPHPDVESGIRPGAAPADQVSRYADVVADRMSMAHLLDQVDELHTLTSLSGFEALLRQIPVTTWGLPFYAGWGITVDHEACPRRTRKLSLDELVAGTLITYPRYVDRSSEWPCEAEDVVGKLSFWLLQRDTKGLLGRRRTKTLVRQLLGLAGKP
jgi:capsular polysaccharide export protein